MRKVEIWPYSGETLHDYITRCIAVAKAAGAPVSANHNDTPFTVWHDERARVLHEWAEKES